jgi:hypothetical protein
MKTQYLKGKWTNDRTDLICEIVSVHHVYENGDVKVKYMLYNKKNNIFYETKSTKLRKLFFDWNYKVR